MKYQTLAYSSGLGCKYQKVSDVLKRLDQEVNKGIQDGWRPVGGVSIAVNELTAVVAQAMVRDDPTPAQGTPEGKP